MGVSEILPGAKKEQLVLRFHSCPIAKDGADTKKGYSHARLPWHSLPFYPFSRPTHRMSARTRR
jgi:hypothetical protein